MPKLLRKVSVHFLIINVLIFVLKESNIPIKSCQSLSVFNTFSGLIKKKYIIHMLQLVTCVLCIALKLPSVESVFQCLNHFKDSISGDNLC